MKTFETIILGSGASGAMCAMSYDGKNVAIIDNQNKLAKKVLVTGNGKCNLTNINIDRQKSTDFYNENIKLFLDRFGTTDALNFFSSIGLETFCDEQGRCYPISSSAKSVQDTIIRQINKKNVTVFTEHQILEVKKDGDDFVILTDKEIFSCKKLVFSLGGNSAGLLRNFGIKTKPCVPSLCALKTQKTKLLSGKRLENVLVSAINYKTGETKSEVGEVLFKDDGLSGIAIFNMSACFARNNDFNGQVQIDLLPHMSEENLKELLIKRRDKTMNVSEFFVGLFINEIAYTIFEKCKTDENRTSDKLTQKEIETFARIIKNLTFEVNGHYDNNQVFSGGVEMSGLDKNLQSKKVPNLYICGEACDVDGLCGGFNLQWAWTSGYIVGKSL